MRESCTYGSARGARDNSRPYRDWESPRKFGHEPARIGRLSRACARPRRRGRAERDDHGQTVRSQAACGTRQRPIEPGEIGWRDAARRVHFCGDGSGCDEQTPQRQRTSN